mmetsp:Transcript_53317/g.59626  ORF Transcript_53317/g.59626 Transcript_53317/m.59626 type:complete len:92 (+) Transcript_53317:31-306(+)
MGLCDVMGQRMESYFIHRTLLYSVIRFDMVRYDTIRHTHTILPLNHRKYFNSGEKNSDKITTTTRTGTKYRMVIRNNGHHNKNDVRAFPYK